MPPHKAPEGFKPKTQVVRGLVRSRLVHPKIIVSSAPRAKNASDIQRAGVEHVISLAPAPKDLVHALGKMGVKHTQLNYGFNEPEQYAEASREIAPLVEDGEKILVHCSQGNRRSPTTAGFVLRMLGHTPEEAMELVGVGKSSSEGLILKTLRIK